MAGKTFRALGALGLVVAVGAAAAGSADAQQPKRGGTFVFAMAADANFTNRNVSTANPDGLIGCILYQGLTTIDGSGTGKVIPMLAKSWQITDDGKTYTFELNEAKWHDGKPFTSADVKYTFTEISPKYSATFEAVARALDSIETPTPNRVVMKLKQPFGPLLLTLGCMTGGGILPQHIFQGTDVMKNPAMTSAPVGIGPFMLTEWKRGDFIRMKRNPNYYEPGKPYFDEVIAKIMPQPAARTAALMAGEVDYVSYLNLPTSDNAAVAAKPGLVLTRATNAPSADLMILNVNRKPLDDKRVRQALLMGIDREYFLKTVFQNLGAVGTMPFPSRLTSAVNPNVDYRKMYPYDVARANALLDEAGYKRGADGTRFKLQMVYATSYGAGELTALTAKNMWQQLGIDLQILPSERTVAAKIIYQDRATDIGLESLSSFFDPAIGMAPIYTTGGIGKTYSNGSGYSNPKVDALFQEAQNAASDEARSKAYQEIQAILADELPTLATHESVLYNGQTTRLKGWENENSQPTWRDAWFEN